MRKIKVCAGVGDNCWLLQKLWNADEKFHFMLPDGKPQRGKQVFDLLPQVAASAEYVPHFTYQHISEQNIQNFKKNWIDIDEQEFFLSCNRHLERGKRIENFLPDLVTSFRLPWVLDGAKVLLDPKKQYIGIFGSSYNTARKWGFWDEDKWMELIRMIHRHEPEYVFAIIGAEWDLDLGRNLVKMLEAERIPYIDTIGNDLQSVILMMKSLKYFFSFPSGLGIIAPTVECPTTMFYPDGKRGAPNYVPMMNAWAHPQDIETGLYKGCAFCEPEAIFKWVIQHKKI